MEKELKEYLEKITGEISGMKDELGGVKEDISGVKKELVRVEKSLSAKIDKVEKKLAKKIDDNIDYTKLLDQELSEHRRNTEMHHVGSRKA